MDELHQAVAPYLNTPGGGGSAANPGGGGGGCGPFDVVAVETNDSSQTDVLDAAKNEDYRSSREYRSVEKHMDLCEKRIDQIYEKTLDKYHKGELQLKITDESDIRRGVDAYFADLTEYESNGQRLRHIRQVHKSLGNPDSPLWKELKRLIE